MIEARDGQEDDRKSIMLAVIDDDTICFYNLSQIIRSVAPSATHIHG